MYEPVEILSIGGGWPLIISAALVLTLLRSFRILWEYERGVVFLLGRFWKVKGPGLIIVIPFFQKMVLRYLQTLGVIAEEQNSTIVFPLPLEMMSLLEGIKKEKKE